VLNTADNDHCYLKSCAGPLVASPSHIAAFIDPSARLCAGGVRIATQRAVHIHATRTVFELEAAPIAINMTFLSTMFTDDHVRLSRPVYYVDFSTASLDASSHSVQIYLGLSGEHSTNTEDQPVTWSRWNGTEAAGVRIGSADQKVLGSKGDGVNIDWCISLCSLCSPFVLSVSISSFPLQGIFVLGSLQGQCDVGGLARNFSGCIYCQRQHACHC
jgi:hypothetical protein